MSSAQILSAADSYFPDPESWQWERKFRLARKIEPSVYGIGAIFIGLRGAEAARERFQQLVTEWRADAEVLSSTVQMALHPAYQQIIGLGQEALPLIFSELRYGRAIGWFWALRAIIGEDPAADAANVREATEAWLRWGDRQGYLALDDISG